MIMMKDHCVVWVGGLLLYFGHTLTPSTLLFGALLSCLPMVSQSPGYHVDTAPGYHGDTAPWLPPAPTVSQPPGHRWLPR